MTRTRQSTRVNQLASRLAKPAAGLRAHGRAKRAKRVARAARQSHLRLRQRVRPAAQRRRLVPCRGAAGAEVGPLLRDVMLRRQWRRAGVMGRRCTDDRPLPRPPVLPRPPSPPPPRSPRVRWWWDTGEAGADGRGRGGTHGGVGGGWARGRGEEGSLRYSGRRAGEVAVQAEAQAAAQAAAQQVGYSA